MKQFLVITLLSLIFVGCGEEAATGPDALTLSNIGTKTVTKGGQALSFSVRGTDPDGLTLTYSIDGSVGSGANPEDSGASIDASSGVFSWDVTNVTAGSYYVEITVSNTVLLTASETVQIVVQEQGQTSPPTTQYDLGLVLYNADCETCHGPGGRFGTQTQIQCMDSVTFDEKINGGSMSGYASSWSTTDDAAVLFYLNNVEPTRC